MERSFLHFFSIIAGIFALALIAIEICGMAPAAVAVLLPLAGALALYNLSRLLENGGRLKRFFFSARGAVAFGFLVAVSFLCCTPINEMTRYLLASDHPFRQYRWLAVSVMGLTCALSFLNYELRRPAGNLRRLTGLCEAAGRLPPGYFIVLCALWVFAAANLLSYTAFEHIPHVQDEIAQFLQAKIFARGSLTAPLPPIPEFFQYFYDNMVMTDRWYSQYPPGHPLVLMLGVLLHMPWIINPLLAALSVVLLYKAAASYYGEGTARLSALLFCLSPFVLFMSASFMNHVSILFFLLLFLYALGKSAHSGSTGSAVIAGLALGMMVNIRVGEACALGLVFGMVFLIYSLKKKKYAAPALFALAALGMTGALLVYNYATNGDPLLFGYQVRWGSDHTLGFPAAKVMQAPVHTPLRGVIHTLSNFIALNQYLFEWPFPSLVPLIVFFMPFVFTRDRKDYLLLGGVLAAPVFYFFYFYQDLCLGPRFYYVSLPFILPLTARSLMRIIKSIAAARRCSEQKVRHAFIVLMLLATVFACVFRMPRLYRYYADSFWKVDNRLMSKVRELHVDQALVFQRSYDKNGDALGSGLLYNSPWLDTPVVFARDLGPRNAELAAFFPGRSFYLALKDEQGNVLLNRLSLSPDK